MTDSKAKDLFKAWWQASRPPFFIATMLPLFLAFVAAGKDAGNWEVFRFAWVLAACFALQMNANIANDLFDHLQGVDAGDNIGGSRVLQEGKLSIAALKKAIMGLYAFAFLVACAGVWWTGLWGILPIVIFGILSSLLYVAPPVKYGHRGLGELMVCLNMGLVMVAGTYYVLTGVWSARLIALSLPMGLMVAGVLYYQSLPEIETDKAAGKNTLAGLLGPVRAVFALQIWWPLAWVLLANLWLVGLCAWPVFLGIAASLLLHIRLNALVRQAGDDWLSLDKHGHYVRKMYMISAIFFIAGVGCL